MGTVHAEGNIAAGKAKAAMCFACHGADGNSTAPTFPKLAGQGQAYLIKQLHDFKSGKRKNSIMNGMAGPLSDTDIVNLAAYFSSLPRSSDKVTDEKLAKEGEALYRGGDKERKVPACMGCHAPNGVGNEPAKFPSLYGQHAAYIVTQLENFQNGTRDNDPNKMMRTTTAMMSTVEMKALAQYISGMPAPK